MKRPITGYIAPHCYLIKGVQIMHIFIAVLAAGDGKRGYARVLIAALNPLKSFDWPESWLSEAMTLSQQVLSCWQLVICQKYFYVPKLPQNRALKNQKFMSQLTKLASKAPFARRDPNRSISHIHIPFVNILVGADVGHRQFTATVHLGSTNKLCLGSSM